MLFHAFGADAVADVDAGVLVEVDVDLLPVALVIADFLAEGAQRQDFSQRPDFRQRFLQPLDEILAFLLGFFSAGDVPADAEDELRTSVIRSVVAEFDVDAPAACLRALRIPAI